jgi:hypothetical protein
MAGYGQPFKHLRRRRWAESIWLAQAGRRLKIDAVFFSYCMIAE